MAESIQIVAYTGGELRVLSGGIDPGEAVLALPLSRLVVKMVRVAEGEDPVAVATPVLAALSPFPDEPLTVSCETVSETEKGRVVLAAALPESAADDIADALDAAKLNVTRVDALALGELRALWGQLGNGGRRLVLLKGADCISLFVLDDDVPSAVRAITSEGDLRREVMLSLLEAEDFSGGKPLSEIVVSGDVDVAGLDAFAPVRRIEGAGEEAVFAGIEARSADPAALDVLPDSWREVLEETRFKSKLKRFLAIAGGIWALVMLVLFGVPVVFGLLTDHQRTLSREHSRQYKAVRETKEKVNLVRKYSDHSRGALEIMLAVSSCLPLPEDADTSCIELNSWNFKREDGVRFSGEADSAQLVYNFKRVQFQGRADRQRNLRAGQPAGSVRRKGQPPALRHRLPVRSRGGGAMNNMSLREKAVLAVIGTVLLYGLAVVLWFTSQESAWTKAARTYKSARDTYEKESRLIGERQKWNDAYEDEKSQMPTFAFGKEKGDVLELPIEVRNWEGALVSLVEFLHELENTSDGMFDVGNINFKPSSKKGYLRGSFTLTCAYMRED